MTDKKNIFSKSKKQLLSEKIHDEILEMIIKNATDEDMVLNEGRLMEVFQVSKAPVREALIKLCAEGVLQSVPRYGYLVIRQQEKDKREVSRMRVLLELEALKEGYEEIIQYHLPELLQQIEGINGAKQIDDVWAIWEDNCEFICSWHRIRRIVFCFAICRKRWIARKEYMLSRHGNLRKQ